MSAPCHSPGCSPTHTVGGWRTLPALPPRAEARLQRILHMRRLAGRSVHGLGPAGDGLYLALVHTLWGRDLTGPIVEADLLAAILEHPTDGVSGLRLERLVKPRQFEPWGRR